MLQARLACRAFVVACIPQVPTGTKMVTSAVTPKQGQPFMQVLITCKKGIPASIAATAQANGVIYKATSATSAVVQAYWLGHVPQMARGNGQFG
jgi:hypothetical protein